jgi:acyl-CoA synthetase (AMP-forming)/AMP-acid ligase II
VTHPWTNLVDVLRWRSDNEPDRRAYTFLANGDDAEVHASYAQMDSRARAVGGALQRRGAQGERILLLCPPGLEYIVGLFGCLYAGAVPVPAYPPPLRLMHRGMLRLAAIAESAQARFLISTADIANRAASLRAEDPRFATLHWLDIDDLERESADAWEAYRPKPESMAILQYTSGATGAAKGIVLTHENLLYNLSIIRECFRVGPDSRTVSWLPPYHDMGLIGGILEPLYAGFPVVLFPPLRFIQRPARWLRAIARHQAAVSGGPNFAYDLCVQRTTAGQRDGLDLSSWRVAFNGSEPVQADTMKRFAAAFGEYGFRADAFHPCYGLAEATLFVAGGRGPRVRVVDKAALQEGRVLIVEASADVDAGLCRTLVSSGRSYGRDEIVIVDPERQIQCASDRVGEIWVRGPGISESYWKRPQETLESLRAHLADSGHGPFLRTGDLGFVVDGELFVTGRLKDLIIIRGLNHYPQDIERTAEASHPGLQAGEAAAFSVEIEGEERLVIVQAVERARMSRLSMDCAQKAIIEAVARHHGLSASVVVLVQPGTIPRTSSGKIARDACRRRFLARTLEPAGRSVDAVSASIAE